MDTDPLEHDHASRPVPPSYEQCIAGLTGPRADYVIPPSLMVALFDWEDEQDE